MNAQNHGQVYSRDPAGPKVEILGGTIERGDEVLTPLALQLLASLHRRFNARRLELLNARRERQLQLDDGALPEFLAATAGVRAADWRIAPVPADLADRRVEITGPVDRKMVINALNAPVRCFMADFEDSCSPTWENIIHGQVNLSDAIRRTISFEDPATGKVYRLAEHTATLIVRPRGWHLPEKHVRINGEQVSGALFDFALFLANNHEALARRGTGPYFYLPKMESHLEARLWNEVFIAAQEALGMPRGTIKATVLIETILAAFEMDEILHELREHSAGLNCGRWDYIFSFIKKFRNRPDFVLPDRGHRDDGPALPEVLRRSADQDLPPPRRARHGRHGGADPDPRRSGGERGGHGARARRQAARGARRSRRHLDRAPGPGADRARGLRLGDARAEPARRDARRRATSARSTCCRCRRVRSPRRACAPASAWACSTSRRGCAATAACRSTT